MRLIEKRGYFFLINSMLKKMLLSIKNIFFLTIKSIVSLNFIVLLNIHNLLSICKVYLLDFDINIKLKFFYINFEVKI